MLIVDLDDTLWNWFDAWHQSFSAMLNCLTKESGICREKLIEDIRRVHKSHGTSEYNFLIEEIECLKEASKGAFLLADKYSNAVNIYKEKQNQHLKTYPTVRKSLERLKKKGVLLIGLTDGMAYGIKYRINKLEMEGLLNIVYLQKGYEIPSYARENLSKYPYYYVDNMKTEFININSCLSKPNTEILQKILSDTFCNKEDVVCVGDSKSKDIKMAQNSGILDVYAKYGDGWNKEKYSLLREVSHWSETDINNGDSSSVMIKPTIILENTFGEIFDHVTFCAHQ